MYVTAVGTILCLNLIRVIGIGVLSMKILLDSLNAINLLK
jgi:hypothetical protein